jgi:hypothetical protein
VTQFSFSTIPPPALEAIASSTKIFATGEVVASSCFEASTGKFDTLSSSKRDT